MTGSYRFLPWARRGLAAGIDAADTTGAVAARAGIDVRLQLDDGTQPGATVQLHGPGDVAGIDPRVVLRVDPPAGTSDAEPNYLAAIEFDPPDLPWLFTPAAATGPGRLRPWCVLVVVREQNGVSLGPAPGAMTPILAIRSPAVVGDELPDLVESWAWAHAQVLHDSAVALDVTGDLAARPVANLSRLICPRRLEPDRSYIACVVPAFAHGVARARGLPVEGTQTGPAWDRSELFLDLPAYYSWRFATGPDGDIESLANALVPIEAPADLGGASVYLGAATPDLALPTDAAGATVRVRGALAAPPRPPPLTPDPEHPQVGAAVRAEIEQSRATGALGPPVYGEWPADQHDVPAAGWLAEANVTAAHRVAAGLGAAVVRSRQEDLVQAAWDQVGDLRAVNTLVNRALLASRVGQRLVDRHVRSLPTAQAAQLTRAWQDRVAAPDPGGGGANPTVSARVAASSLPGELMAAAFRRLAAPRRPAARRAARAGLTRQRTLLDLDAGDVLGLDVAGATSTGLDSLPQVLEMQIPIPPPDEETPRVSLAPLGLPVIASMERVQSLQRAAIAGQMTGVVTVGPLIDSGVRVRDEFARDAPAAEIDPDMTAVERFRGAWNALQPQLALAPPTPEFLSADLATMQADVALRAAPRNTVAMRQAQRLAMTDEPSDPPPMSGLRPRGPDNVPAQIAAYPLIAGAVAPMLDALPGSWLLPGVADLDMDRVTLVETNPGFIASCLLGTNSEFNAELLWREYPTDRRGTPLRRFWPRTDGADDIGPINAWPADATLADLPTGDVGQLVLVVRGRLLLRYPDIVIYAVRGTRTGPSDDDPNAVILPIFNGRISPDISYVGFPLTRNSVAGADIWFVLQQQSAAPRFGFDVDRPPIVPLQTWNDVAWSDLETSPGAHLSPLAAAPQALNLPPGGVGTATVQTHGIGPTSAEFAAATLQRPMRVAIHASRLLPPMSPS